MPSRRPSPPKAVADVIERHPDRFLFGTDEVAPPDQAAYMRVYNQYEPMFKLLGAERTQQASKRELRKDIRLGKDQGKSVGTRPPLRCGGIYEREKYNVTGRKVNIDGLAVHGAFAAGNFAMGAGAVKPTPRKGRRLRRRTLRPRRPRRPRRPSQRYRRSNSKHSSRRSLFIRIRCLHRRWSPRPIRSS